MGRARGTNKTRSAWPEELRDLQRRGGMAPDWHETWHGAGEGVREAPERFFSSVFPGVPYEYFVGLRSSPQNFQYIVETISFCDPDRLPDLREDDDVVDSLWKQERLRTEAVMEKIDGPEIDWQVAEKKWKMYFVEEMQNYFFTLGGRAMRFSLLGYLLPGSSGRSAKTVTDPVQSLEVGRALEDFARKHPEDFRQIVQDELLLALAHYTSSRRGGGRMFSEECTRSIIQSALASDFDPFEKLEEHSEFIDWSEEERGGFGKEFLHIFASDAILRPDADPLVADTYAEEACRDALVDTLFLYIYRLRERDDFEERMKKILGADWDKIREHLLRRFTAEELPLFVARHLTAVVENVEEMDRFAQGTLSAREIFLQRLDPCSL